MSARLAALAAGAICCAAGALAAEAGAVDGAPDAATWVTDGPVHALARAGERTFIGGDFSQVAHRSGPGVQLAAGDAGAPSPDFGSFPEVAGGRVNAVASDGAGGWYIGGTFTHVGGEPRTGAAHLAAGEGGLSLDGWAPAVGGTVHAIAVDRVPGRAAPVVYIGGAFLSLNGDATLQNLAAVDGASGGVAGLLPRPDGPVRGLVVRRLTLEAGVPPAPTPVSIVFVAGGFTAIGVTQNNLAAIWGIGSGETREGAVISGWQPAGAIVGGFKPGLRALLVGAPKVNPADATVTRMAVHIGGQFGLSSYRLGMRTSGPSVGAAETAPAIVNFGPNAAVSCIDDADPGCIARVNALGASPDHGVLYLGGRLTAVQSVQKRNLAAINGAPDPFVATTPQLKVRSWSPEPDGAVHALAHSAADAAQPGLYAGGNFTHVDGAARDGLAALKPSASETADDSETFSWDPRPSGDDGDSKVAALAATPTTLFAGGSFTGLGAAPRANLAALDSTGALIDTWDAGTNGPVDALAVNAERLFVGGSFTALAGDERRRLGAVRTTDGALEPFRADVEPCAGSGCASTGVLSLALRDSTLYVGGSFGSVAGTQRRNAAAVSAVDGTVAGWAPEADGHVRSLLPTCGTVYAGGSFTSIGGAARARIASLDPGSGSASGWNPSADGTVFDLARDQDTVYAAGSFANVGGRGRDGLAALDAGSGSATTWDPAGGGDFRAVAVPPGGSTVYAGGRFKEAGAAEFSHLAAFDRQTGARGSWADADDTVHALATDGASLFAAGAFRRLGPRMQQGLGSFALGGSVTDQAVLCEKPVEPVPEPVPEPAPEPPPPAERPVTARDLLAPELTGVAMTRTRFRVVRRSAGAQLSGTRPVPKGSGFRYSLSEVAVTRLAFTRRTRVRCPSAKAKRPCYRWRKAGAARRLSPAGRTKARFSGKVGRRWLRPGRYRVRIRATDIAGNRSRAVRLAFTIVDGRSAA